MNDVQPDPQSIVQFLRDLGMEASAEVHGDDLGWFRLDLVFAKGGQMLQVARFLAKEEGIRAELNTWAAWLETLEEQPMHSRLMQQVISTVQMLTWQSPTGDS